VWANELMLQALSHPDYAELHALNFIHLPRLIASIVTGLDDDVIVYDIDGKPMDGLWHAGQSRVAVVGDLAELCGCWSQLSIVGGHETHDYFMEDKCCAVLLVVAFMYRVWVAHPKKRTGTAPEVLVSATATPRLAGSSSVDRGLTLRDHRTKQPKEKLTVSETLSFTKTQRRFQMDLALRDQLATVLHGHYVGYKESQRLFKVLRALAVLELLLYTWRQEHGEDMTEAHIYKTLHDVKSHIFKHQATFVHYARAHYQKCAATMKSETKLALETMFKVLLGYGKDFKWM
jgi:hypothetical protein